MIDYKLIAARSTIETTEKWRENSMLIPYIQFKPEWEVKIIPPFTGAIVRFMVRYNGNTVSVYLDFFDNLGLYGEPYWEVYPVNDDTARHAMNDISGLLDSISEGLCYTGYNNLIKD